MSALAQVIDHLDEATIRKMILPKTKQLFDIDTKVRRIDIQSLYGTAGTAAFTGCKSLGKRLRRLLSLDD